MVLEVDTSKRKSECFLSESRFMHRRRCFYNVHCSCLFSYIPDEVLVELIFKGLSRKELGIVAGVCKRWNSVANDKNLWKFMALGQFPKGMEEFQVLSLLKKHENAIERLKLCNGRQMKNPLNEIIKLKMLKEIHLCDIPWVKNEWIKEIIENCRLLNEVYLGGCSELIDAAFEGLKDREIRILSIRGCTQVTSKILDFIPESCIEINFSGCSSIQLLGSDCSVFKLLGNLVKLNLQGVTFNDSLLLTVSKFCTKIEQLNLSSANPFSDNLITDRGLIALGNLQNLVDLNLMGSRQITDQGLSILSSKCLNMTKLSLGFCIGITDIGIDSISQNLKNLNHLSLTRCPLIGDPSIRSIGNSLLNMSYLDLTGCELITSAVLCYFIDHFSRLKFLNLGLCRNLRIEEIDRLRSIRTFEVKFY
jgi:hypothetical protein